MTRLQRGWEIHWYWVLSQRQPVVQRSQNKFFLKSIVCCNYRQLNRLVTERTNMMHTIEVAIKLLYVHSSMSLNVKPWHHHYVVI